MKGFFLATIIILSLVSTAPAMANFVTYAEWRAQPEMWRWAYVAGAVDSLLTFPPQGADQGWFNHYNTCLGNAHMNAGQVAANLASFVDSRPELQAKAVQIGLITYLQGLCGQPSQ
jgi:hypothetical protein